MEDNAVLDDLNDCISKFEENLKVTHEKASSLRFPKKKHEPENPLLKSLLQDKLRLEAECEVLRNTELSELPLDQSTLMAIGKEQSREKVLKQHEFLEFQQSLLRETVKEHNELEQMVHDAKLVDTKLQSLVDSPQEEDVLATLRRKYVLAGEVFKILREEFFWLISTLFPEEHLEVENILNQLTARFVEDPSDPYVEFDPDDVNMELLNFLVRAQLVLRNSDEPFKFRLIDLSRE